MSFTTPRQPRSAHAAVLRRRLRTPLPRVVPLAPVETRTTTANNLACKHKFVHARDTEAPRQKVQGESVSAQPKSTTNNCFLFCSFAERGPHLALLGSSFALLSVHAFGKGHAPAALLVTTSPAAATAAAAASHMPVFHV